MTENKNPGNDPSAEFERQRKRKVLLFTAILGCIFLVVLWFIFRPAPVKPQEGAAGINTSVPDGKAQATVGDKRKAAEQLRSEEQQQKRMMTLGDNSFSLLDDGLKPAEEPVPADNPAGCICAFARNAAAAERSGFALGGNEYFSCLHVIHQRHEQFCIACCVLREHQLIRAGQFAAVFSECCELFFRCAVQKENLVRDTDAELPLCNGENGNGRRRTDDGLRFGNLLGLILLT